jgi:hypothetical protein
VRQVRGGYELELRLRDVRKQHPATHVRLVLYQPYEREQHILESRSGPDALEHVPLAVEQGRAPGTRIILRRLGGAGAGRSHTSYCRPATAQLSHLPSARTGIKVPTLRAQMPPAYRASVLARQRVHVLCRVTKLMFQEAT